MVQGGDRIAGYGARAKQYAKDCGPEDGGGASTEREDFKVFWDAPAVVIISGPIEDCCRAGLLLILSALGRRERTIAPPA